MPVREEDLRSNGFHVAVISRRTVNYRGGRYINRVSVNFFFSFFEGNPSLFTWFKKASRVSGCKASLVDFCRASPCGLHSYFRLVTRRLLEVGYARFEIAKMR